MRKALWCVRIYDRDGFRRLLGYVIASADNLDWIKYPNDIAYDIIQKWILA